MTKLGELLGSRRLWAAIVSAAAAIICFAMGLIDAERMAGWLEIAGGIYAGSLGIEHAGGVIAGAAKAAEEGGRSDRTTLDALDTK